MVKKTILSFCHSESSRYNSEDLSKLLNLHALPHLLYQTSSLETYTNYLKTKQPDAIILNYSTAITLLQHSTFPEKEALSYVLGKTEQGIYKVPMTSVIYIESSGKNAVIQTQKTRYTTEQTLKHLSQQFPQDLIRIHRKILISKQHLSHIQKDTNDKFYVTIPSLNRKLWISRRQLPYIKSLLLNDEK